MNTAYAFSLNRRGSISIPDHMIGNLEAQALRNRQLTIAAIYHAGSGHPGGSLSAIDILTCLYGAELNVTREHFATNPPDPTRDRFVLSKGHAAPALYATAVSRGLVAPNDLCKLRHYGSLLQGHPHVLDTPFVETSTGSLGQGFSVAAGIALGLRHQGNEARTYTMLGDGELQEGEVWECAMFSAHHKLDNLCAIIDYNKLQSDDLNANIMGLEPLTDKWRSFGWFVQEIDGHNIAEILTALRKADQTKGQPSVIIAHTVKGRDVDFMEGDPAWHGSVKLSDADVRRALKSLALPSDEIERWINGQIR